MRCLLSTLHQEPVGRGDSQGGNLGFEFRHQKQFYVQVTWGSASGLDSKMTMRTPIGTVFWTTSRLLEIFVRLMIDDSFLREEQDLMLEIPHNSANIGDAAISDLVESLGEVFQLGSREN